MASCPNDSRRREFNAMAMQYAESRLPAGTQPFGRVYGFTRKDWMKGKVPMDQVAGFLVECNRHALAFEVRGASVIFRQHLDDHRDYACFDVPRAWTLELTEEDEALVVRESSFGRPRTHDQIILLTPAGNPIDPSYRSFRPETGDVIIRIFEGLHAPVAVAGEPVAKPVTKSAAKVKAVAAAGA